MTRARMFALWLGLGPALSFAIAVLFADGFADPRAARALAIAYSIPIVFATVLLQGPILKQPLVDPLGLSFRLNRWWLHAWLAPVLVLLIGVFATVWLTGVDAILDSDALIASRRLALSEIFDAEQLANFDRNAAESPPRDPLWFWLVVQGLPAGVTFNLLIALATEVGFRGFLFREVQGGFWTRSLVIGLVEALWFVPPIFFGLYFPDNRELGVAVAIAFCLLVSPISVYIRVRAKSTVAVAAFRGTVIALASAGSDLCANAPDWSRPFYGAGGVIGFAVLLVLFALHDRFLAEQGLMFSRPAKAPASREEE